jgi:hypothetical protein
MTRHDFRRRRRLLMRFLGGTGSGDFGHSGRKGSVGGSGLSSYSPKKLESMLADKFSTRKASDIADALINHPEIRSGLKIPAVLYHVTPKSNANSIAKNGLQPGHAAVSDRTQGRGVYLTDHPDSVRQEGVNTDNTDVYQVKTSGLNLRLDPEYFPGSTVESAKQYIQDVNSGTENFALYSRDPIPKSALTKTKMRAGRRSLLRALLNHPRVLGGPGSGDSGMVDVRVKSAEAWLASSHPSANHVVRIRWP